RRHTRFSRDWSSDGALPISPCGPLHPAIRSWRRCSIASAQRKRARRRAGASRRSVAHLGPVLIDLVEGEALIAIGESIVLRKFRSEERRVGKAGGYRWSSCL